MHCIFSLWVRNISEFQRLPCNYSPLHTACLGDAHYSESQKKNLRKQMTHQLKTGSPIKDLMHSLSFCQTLRSFLRYFWKLFRPPVPVATKDNLCFFFPFSSYTALVWDTLWLGVMRGRSSKEVNDYRTTCLGARRQAHLPKSLFWDTWLKAFQDSVFLSFLYSSKWQIMPVTGLGTLVLSSIYWRNLYYGKHTEAEWPKHQRMHCKHTRSFFLKLNNGHYGTHFVALVGVFKFIRLLVAPPF